MKTIRYFLALAAVAAIAGCATTFRPWLLSEVHEGMSKEQVVKVLGEPDFVEMKDGTEHLHYTYREDYNPSLSADTSYEADATRELRAMEVKRSMEEYHYVVIFADGKVVNYKELTD